MQLDLVLQLGILEIWTCSSGYLEFEIDSIGDNRQSTKFNKSNKFLLLQHILQFKCLHIAITKPGTQFQFIHKEKKQHEAWCNNQRTYNILKYLQETI